MTTKEAITLFKYYLQSNHKTRTIESYTLLLDRFCEFHPENNEHAFRKYLKSSNGIDR